MTTFDLRQLVRDTAADRDEWKLDALTKLVFDRTPRAQLREAYWQALREFARRELAYAPRSDQPGSGDQSMSVGSGQTSTGTSHARTGAPGPAAGAGGNLRNSRSAMLRRFGFRYRVHIGEGRWRNILDCTGEELLYAAAECDQMAESNAAAAERYRKLAKALAEHDAERVADLPPGVVTVVFGDA